MRAMDHAIMMGATCVLLVALFTFFIMAAPGYVFGFSAYGPGGVHMAEVMDYAGEFALGEMSDEELVQLNFDSSELPQRVRENTIVPRNITPLYRATSLGSSVALRYIERGLDMSLDGNLRALTILPVVEYTGLAEGFAKFSCWDGLRIEATKEGESSSELAIRFGENRIAEILEEIESREPVTVPTRSVLGICLDD
mgnify:CR=1 FL=1